ncbi:DUF3298 and DUF4163 domain-containing protein [Legionella israelensis]|uniref:Endo-1,4-beta-xylanase-like protein n=1 Tax=Legionella israelensis TaxID=454 RepID=A0A0W0W7D5_9GAMM|nr:DUF3298 and DUF4163 domain-containing protein [Legionella israelensis]KTD28126.1 endo-1,4-beta-xylanase-like protein [Legionella israelensis]QBS08893.1 DUF3298 domain-containing protein [Legionella israelensis]SCY31183.1 protein of unknown function [Legionella israelensis DSM 19235]STX58580.1 endo-1,4-beta-xylanase-like protein [Legionella israelensis]
MTIYLLRTCGFVLLCTVSLLANAVQTKAIQKETKQYILDIKYPQGFSSKEVDSTIKQKIELIQNEFIRGLSDEADLPQDVPGKNGLTITYAIPYRQDSVLSVRLMISTYHHGAAHPNNQTEVLNFIRNKLVTLDTLFKKDSDYLKIFADYSRKKLLTKEDFDKQWVLTGTEPKADNYKKWYFQKEGFVVIFDTYQVAAYVYGPQTVTIPLSVYRTMLKPDILNSVWGS